MKQQVRVRKSKIHGHGVFAVRDLKQGEVIEYEPRSVNYHGYNHSCEPNTVLGRINWNGYHSNIVVVVFKDVPKGTELTVNYNNYANRNTGKVDGKNCNCPLHRKRCTQRR